MIRLKTKKFPQQHTFVKACHKKQIKEKYRLVSRVFVLYCSSLRGVKAWLAPMTL